MRVFTRLVFALCITLAGMTARADQINFDEVADATDISYHYFSRGVLIFCAGPSSACKTLSVYARAAEGAHSGKNVISTRKTDAPVVHGSTTGAILMLFPDKVSRVSIAARSIPRAGEESSPDHVLIGAFDSNRKRVGEVVAGTAHNTWEKLSISAPDNRIEALLLGVDESHGGNVEAQFDTLRFERVWRPLGWIPVVIVIVLLGVVGAIYVNRKHPPADSARA
ncbi:MAG: hypothetical protein KF778_12950 [Rhodocyclaceae bacterium]|nr:hypothetical protein [Rhodocyclaceae bacterium]MBX3669301.1 hypothetical protein [Rhodocyclaceae bacterium]